MRLALLLTVFCLAACAQGAGDARGGAKDDSLMTRRPVSIAAASDLRFPLDEIIASFSSREPGIDVTVSYGSSGNFYSQLSNGAPFDIFLSADIEYPRKLVAGGQGLSETLFPYAVGQIVVWTPKSSAIDLERLGVQALAAPEARSIAIANPQHAPYGRAAESAMKTLGVYEAVKGRLVLGENIAQTAQFIESGAADIGIIALSLAMSPSMRDKGHYWRVPLDAYPRLEQGGVILSWARDRDAAQRFIAYMRGADGRKTLGEYGFMMPGE